LEHRRLHVEHFFKKHGLAKVRLEQLRERERRAWDLDLIARAGQLPVTRARRAVVFIILSQRAISLEKFHYRSMVVLGEGLVERALFHALGQQLGYMAASIVDGLALADGFAVKYFVILQQCAARRVHLDLKFHSQFVAITQHGLVYGGQARGAAVEIISFVERTFLRCPVIEDQLRSGTRLGCGFGRDHRAADRGRCRRPDRRCARPAAGDREL
jgi:hypothetical protein